MDENKDLTAQDELSVSEEAVAEEVAEESVSAELTKEDNSFEEAGTNELNAPQETTGESENEESGSETDEQTEKSNIADVQDEIQDEAQDGQDEQNEQVDSEEGFYNVKLSDEELDEEDRIELHKTKVSAVIVASFALLAVIAIVIVLIVVIKYGKDKDSSTDMSSTRETSQISAVPAGTDSDATADADTATVNDADASEEAPSEPIDYTDYGVTVTLGDYKNLKFEVLEPTVTDEEVDVEVDSFLEALTEIRDITDRAAQEGDTVTIDFDGIVDGEHHDSTTGTDFEVTIGSHRTITGFEDGIVGLNVGDTKVLNLTFPDPYTNPDFAGKPVDFTITVKSIRAPFTPELTDEVVAENTDYETVEAFLENTRAELLSDKKENAVESAFEAAVDDLVKKSTFSSEVEKEIADRIEYYRRYYDNYFMQYFGVDALTYSSMTQEQYDEMLRNISEPEVKYPYIYKEIAKAEGYSPSEEERAARFHELFYDMYGFESEEEIYKTFTKKMCDQTVEYELLSRYGYNYLRKSLGLSTLDD